MRARVIYQVKQKDSWMMTILAKVRWRGQKFALIISNSKIEENEEGGEVYIRENMHGRWNNALVQKQS